MDKKAPQNSTRATASAAGDASVAPRPVRSAKEAINAMYAENSHQNLSSYLATSAKEIINSKGSNSKSNSAAKLHHSTTRSRLEARPSASGMLRTAKTEQPPVVHDVSRAMDPLAQKSAPLETRRVVERPATPKPAPAVVKTSLRLKKAPVASKPQNLQSHRRTGLSLNGEKGETTLMKIWAERRAQARAQAKAQAAQAAQVPAQPQTATKQPTPSPDPHTVETLRAMRQAVQQTTQGAQSSASRPKQRYAGLMNDVVRQRRNVDGFSRPQPHHTPTASNDAVEQPSANAPTNHPKAKRPASRPIDSVKRRFRTAPKDFTATAEVQDTAYEAFTDEQNQPKSPIDIYGMMEEDYTVKSEGLGVVEDYHPEGDKVSNGLTEQKVAQGSGTAAPDNNKYALGGQSPFFLKSVSVEKRPLSEAPRPSKGKAASKSTSEGTLYERPDSHPVGGKNVYEKLEAKKPLPTKPTVIIPASRKSKAPLVCLLILTIILGAAVGAFAYLCFFQYME